MPHWGIAMQVDAATHHARFINMAVVEDRNRGRVVSAGIQVMPPANWELLPLTLLLIRVNAP